MEDWEKTTYIGSIEQSGFLHKYLGFHIGIFQGDSELKI